MTNSYNLSQSSSPDVGFEIGMPIITLSNTLNDNEIWLEGAQISKTTYSTLYEVYGDTYGTPENSDDFVLPDFRNKTIWGASDFGYIEAGLPNITGTLNQTYGSRADYLTGAFLKTLDGSHANVSGGGGACYRAYFDASNCNPIYDNSSTVQPPSIKVRVKTRYK